MNEHEFFSIAITEGGTGRLGDYTPLNRASHALSGCIGFSARNKEGFLADGMNFLDNFEENALGKIEEERGNDNDRELIDAFHHLIEQSKQIDRDVFLKLCSDDWDERNEPE